MVIGGKFQHEQVFLHTRHFYVLIIVLKNSSKSTAKARKFVFFQQCLVLQMAAEFKSFNYRSHIRDRGLTLIR